MPARRTPPEPCKCCAAASHTCLTNTKTASRRLHRQPAHIRVPLPHPAAKDAAPGSPGSRSPSHPPNSVAASARLWSPSSTTCAPAVSALASASTPEAGRRPGRAGAGLRGQRRHRAWRIRAMSPRLPDAPRAPASHPTMSHAGRPSGRTDPPPARDASPGTASKIPSSPAVAEDAGGPWPQPTRPVLATPPGQQQHPAKARCDRTAGPNYGMPWRPACSGRNVQRQQYSTTRCRSSVSPALASASTLDAFQTAHNA